MTGGAAAPRRTVLVLTASDRSAAGTRADAVRRRARRRGSRRSGSRSSDASSPDDRAAIGAALVEGAAAHPLVVTTGGTGLTPRDVTPQATAAVLDYEVPGIAEAIRAEGRRSTPFAALSRGLVGVRGGVADRQPARVARRARWSRSRSSSRSSTTRSRRWRDRSTTPPPGPRGALDLPPGLPEDD